MKPHSVLATAVMGLASLAAAGAAQTAPGSPPAKAPPGPAPAFQVPGPAEEQKAENALAVTITAFEAGKPNYDDMEDAIVDAVKAQGAQVSATLNSLGPLKSMDYAGYLPGPKVWRYKGQFAKGQAEMMIGFGPNGKILTLWFKPVAA